MGSCVSKNLPFKSLSRSCLKHLLKINLTTIPLPHMSKKISEKLSEKRFLLVLDDVWTEDPIQWEEFMAFLNGIAPGPGSTILLTTRSREVAVTVGSSDHC